MNNKYDNIAVISLFGIFLATGLIMFLNHQISRYNIDQWMATSPIRFLSYAQKDLNKNRPYECIENLQKAIKVIKSIEYYGDSTSNRYLENAIHDVGTVIGEIEGKQTSLEDLNIALFETLNAIAYAELKISEKYLKEGELKKALVLMNTTLYAAKKSLKYVQPQDSIQENKVIFDLEMVIGSLKNSPRVQSAELNKLNIEIEELMEQDYLN